MNGPIITTPVTAEDLYELKEAAKAVTTEENETNNDENSGN